MLLVTDLTNTKLWKEPLKNTETLAPGYSFEGTHLELSNEYQYDRI